MIKGFFLGNFFQQKNALLSLISSAAILIVLFFIEQKINDLIHFFICSFGKVKLKHFLYFKGYLFYNQLEFIPS